MNKKKITTMLLVIAATTGSFIFDNTKAFADTHKNNVNTFGLKRTSNKGKVVNVETNLRIRKDPSTRSSVIGYLREGQTFEILGKEGSWYEIKNGGRIGFVHEDYVEQINNESRSAGSKGKVINITSTLRLRSSASTSSNVIGYLKNGENFDILGKEGVWYKIKVDGKTGYVHGDYVKVTSTGNTHNNNSSSNRLTENIKQGVVINITSSLRIRKSASTNSETLGYLKNGSKIEIISKSGSWYKIKHGSGYGYVHQDYVKITGENSNNNSSNNNSNNKPPESIKQGIVINITSSLRVRKSASTNSETLGYLKNGSKLEIISKSGSWYKIKHGSGYGYVSQDYVKITNGSSNNSSNNNSNSSNDNKPSNKVEGTGKVINITSNLRVRKGPGTNHGIVGYLLNGDTFDVLGKEGSWYKIKKGSLSGYISQDYVKFYPNGENSNNKPEKPEKPEVMKKFGKVQVNSELRIREKANTSSKIIGNLRNGDIIEILGEENNFYKIKDGNITGFSAKEFIKEISKEEAENNNNNNNKPENGTDVTTNYHMSMDSYIKLQQSRVPAYSYNEYEKYINPNKATNQSQFLRLDEFRNVSVSGLNNYFNSKDAGVLKGHAQGFVNASKKFDIDPLYFAAQSIHETGYGKSKLAKGVTITEIANPDKGKYNSKGELIGYEMIKLAKPVTVYNLFGIGAYDNSAVFPNRALILGTTYAYNHGWTTVDKAIEGAASFVSSNYVNSSKYKQNTLYKMRFSPNVDLIWHQYATTPWYAQSIGAQIEEMKYLYSGNNDFVYDKPKFTESRIVKPTSFMSVKEGKESLPQSSAHVSVDDVKVK